MKTGVYFKLQLKRTLKIYPVIFLITVITLISIGLTCAMLLQRNSSNDDKRKVSVALVGDIDNTYMGAALCAVENLDSSRYAVDFITMSEEDAVKALKNRQINGYVDIPADFVEDIYYGYNTPAKYVTLNGPEGFGTILTAEVVQVVSSLVTESQQGIYSMSVFARGNGLTHNLNENIDRLNIEYIERILNRKSIYKENILGFSDELSVGGYYICGILLFFLMIWGISCNRLLSSKNQSLARSLDMAGLNCDRQMFCEYMSFLIITFGTLLLMAIVMGAAVPNNGFGIPELRATGVFDFVFFVFGSLPVIVMLTAMHMAFYELVTGTVAEVLLQFLIATGLGYISGCFYPNYFFPESVQQLAELLPSGAGFLYLRNLMSGTLEGKNLLLPAVYTVIFVGVAYFVRSRRMAGDSR